MAHRRWPRVARRLLPVMTAGLWVSCGGGSGSLVAPTTGSIQISTTTAGAAPDADGYLLLLDGAEVRSIGTDAAVTLEELEPGTHLVGLSGVAANCEIQGDNPRGVAVTAGETATEAISVACTDAPPSAGSLRVTTATTGTDQDVDGYTVAVESTNQPIGVNGSVTLTSLAAGEQVVQLLGVAANCAVSGDNPRTVTVSDGSTAEVAFAITCAERPPNLGGIQVTTATTGVSPDPDGYTVMVDAGEARAIGVDASASVSDLAPGDHLVALGGVAANCAVDGDNPRTVTVPASAVATLQFDVSCTAPPPSPGTLTVTTVTSGPSPDADGYSFLIDDGAGQPIGANATVSVANVVAGAHALRLAGVAANCSQAGLNPREVTVPANGTVEVTFTLDCGAATGTLRVSTTTQGAPADPDGYSVSVDRGAALAIGASATRDIQGLPPGPHSVALGGLAANCKVQGDNPRSATVTAAATMTVAFTVECAATTGGLAVTISGLPPGIDAAVTVTGPGGFSQALGGSETLDALVPGAYTVAAASVTSGSTAYSASPEQQVLSVAAGATAEVRVTYAAATGPSLNVWITGLYLTQSVQSFDNQVPLVAGRDAFLRVFVMANETNTATPSARVRLYDGGALLQTFTIPAQRGTVPTKREEGVLDASWNLPVPGALVRPGLRFLADVDPDNALAESNESDNDFPASGTPQGVSVRSATPLGITLVPVKQKANNLQGDVSTANRADYLDLTERLYPLPGYDANVHAVYTTSFNGALEPDDGNNAWNTVLSEVEALRVAEGSGRHYYGVVRTGYSSGLVGLGYIGLPTAIGYDAAPDRGRITAHELGHNWDRLHSPCGNPGGTDPNYPYATGQIGKYGFDLRSGILKDKAAPDIMGYCDSPWISDYTYESVLDFRASSGAAAVRAGAGKRPSLLVWGRIVNGRAVLEPAFRVVTRAVLPGRPGPYSVEGRASDGARAFSLSFEAVPVADDPRGARHFAFAVPLDQGTASRLESIRLSGPGVGLAEVTRSMAALRAAPAAPASASMTAGGVAVRWDAATHPVVMVRDAGTGEVLSFARGGEVVVSARTAELDLGLSDGVRTRSVRLRATSR